VLLIPAIDLRAGRCVRLLQGSFERETVYSGEPVAVATQFARTGARRVHVVDLDGAQGSGDNRAVVAEIIRKAGLEVQVAGGIRTDQDAERWLAAGAAAVVMGTTAVRDPAALCSCARKHPGAVWAALDVKDGRPAVAAWSGIAETRLESLLEAWDVPELAGVVVTSIDRDGTLDGPDLALLERVLAAARHPVVYSGGIGSLEDIGQVRRLGASGVILGKALYERRLDLRMALAAS
jgi:phosphoribosylformimino-5-aminoimidazole carboxamide ribotide isomerase